MSQSQVTVSIEYEGGVYLSQPYEFGILPPLILAASKVTGFDLLQIMAQQSASLTQLLEAAPTLRPVSWLGAKNDVTEILTYLFPLLPSAKIAVSSNDISLVLLKLIEPFVETPIPLTEDGKLAGPEPTAIAEQAEPAANTPAPDTIDYRPAQAMAEFLGGYAPIATAPDPVAIADPSGLTSAVTPLQIDTQYAEMLGLLEPI
jgi:hypothetical protein